ncbi:FAD-binding oxidoreductase [Leptolyngbya sp. FACHB-711]|uniref:FAD-binding oxidoreductase n=1 Tax=unclassified Leptolyngbya TaxID=2650499 RepID=UPI001687E80C|nr:FAD-binding oxidoreductase [Leptolyngbya sp. FACHB-711]MBD1850743.1 FAD-binding oxidoreductase [Cyanobacteria bacterium FACHB-502]MBD2025828.1 FAD-binding oxidoreductase [Leptolyngbya sp. FACHB-711]
MSSIAPSLAQSVERILGAGGVVSWDAADLMLRSQISQAVTPSTQIDCIAYPETQEQLAELIACAAQNRWRVFPCGSGSKLHWGGLAGGINLVISTARMNRLIEHAIGDLTVTVEAGMRLADLRAILGKEGQLLAIDPAYPGQATVGGIVATGDTGSLRQRYNSVRDMVIGISFIRSDGQVAKAGGRVVKNVAGYDLMKLLTGSYGTLGMISQITFRIYPLPAASQTVVLTGNSAAIAQAASTLLASSLTPSAIDLIDDRTVGALGLGEGVGLMSRFQTIEVSIKKQTEQLFALEQNLGLAVTVQSGDDEMALWQQLRERIETDPQPSTVTCKIGVLPAQAVQTLAQFSQIGADMTVAQIHAGSGLGVLRFESITLDALLKLRSICQAQGGFLSVQAAPLALKQAIDVWGSSGSSLDLMRRIKQQFDPQFLFSSGRFVGGI